MISSTRGRWRALTIAALATSAFAVTAATASAEGGDPFGSLTGTAPTVVAKAEGVFAEGKFQMEIDCVAKANQTLAAAGNTVIQWCYTTNGVGALGANRTGPVAETAGTGVGALEDFEICARAYSVDVFGVQSDIADRCAPADTATKTAILIM